MNNIDQIVFSLFGKKNLNECSIDELMQFRDSYPFYSTAHFLYTKKLNEENNDAAGDKFSRTSIYYHNPLLVDFLLNERSPKPALMHKDPEPLKAQSEEDPFNDEIVFVNKHGVAERTNGSEKQVGEPKTETPAQQGPLAFEPYHTVDYFASQGIKTVLEEKPKDRFSQQLKSFTDWLRTMKKLPESEIAKGIPAVSEEKVMTMAEHSIENREVVTESMAEVWAKQGHPEKAVEIYEKLSLLNPSKSAYFAGLIENLKDKK